MRIYLNKISIIECFDLLKQGKAIFIDADNLSQYMKKGLCNTASIIDDNEEVDDGEKDATRIIETEQDYEEAIARLSVLMDVSPKIGSKGEAELELLALVIEDYERKIVPEVHVSPVDAILFRMDQMGLRKNDDGEEDATIYQ
jgi:hypothetical protein